MNEECGNKTNTRVHNSGTFRWTYEVETQVLFLGKTHELPLVRERPAVLQAQLVEESPPRVADTQWILEQFHQILVR